jgi:8-oxo-dGTP pyrophosphatase MutT (NUDIX family)
MSTKATIEGERHFTASTYVFGREDASSRWRIVLHHHKKHDRWLIAGGHIEPAENPAQAAVREAKEETGLDVDLVSHFACGTIESYSDSGMVRPPEFILEEPIPARGDEPSHFHVDLLYVAFARTTGITLAKDESHEIGWFTRDEMPRDQMFPSTVAQAERFFAAIEKGELCPPS